MRIAHFSDIHYTLSPFSSLRESTRGKRFGAWASYYIAGRRQRFSNIAARISALLADVAAQNVDHAICTGDVTQVSREDEFAELRKLFPADLSDFTIIPGNHDRYVPSAAGLFERYFGGTFPFCKRVGDVRIIGLDPCRPTSLTNATGLVGEAQRVQLQTFLDEDVTTKTVVALHYGLLRRNGEEDKPGHRLLDAPEVREILDGSAANIVLVLHGHMHGPFTVPTKKRTIIGAGSATDLHVPGCGYFVYDIGEQVTAQRRVWNPEKFAYEAADTTAFNEALRERRGQAYSFPAHA